MSTIVRSIIIREESTPTKTIVINRGPRGLSASLEEYTTLTETFNLTLQNITDKKVTLNMPPANNNISVVIDGAGTPSIFSVDFVLINGNEISWLGLRLESILDNTDTMHVSYLVRS